MKVVILLFFTILISGCKPEYYKPDASLDEQKKDKIECKLEAAKVSGYDWIDTASRQGEVERLCLESKGYTR